MQRINTKTKSKTSTKQLTITALFAALICVTTAYIFHIPFGANGGYIHIGDTLIYLAAAILPAPYAMLAGALGGFLADLFTAPVWAIATLIIKALMTVPFISSGKIVNKRNVFALFAATIISVAGYWVAEFIIFGNAAVALVSIVSSLIQGICSGALFIVFGLALDKTNFKSKLL